MVFSLSSSWLVSMEGMEPAGDIAMVEVVTKERCYKVVIA
jgi:hypothetical protein